MGWGGVWINVKVELATNGNGFIIIPVSLENLVLSDMSRNLNVLAFTNVKSAALEKLAHLETDATIYETQTPPIRNNMPLFRIPVSASFQRRAVPGHGCSSTWFA